MENKLPFPSLKHVSMVHIGTNVLNQREIAEVLLSEKNFRKWPILKEKISGIVDNLYLPKLLLTEQKNVIEHLYIQICNFINFDFRTINLSCDSFPLHPRDVCNRFYFNVRGEINLKKMLGTFLEETFSDCDFHRSILYFIKACNWCLEDCISRLWNRMKENARYDILNYGIPFSPVMAYWLDFIGVTTRSIELLDPYGKNIFYNDDYSFLEYLMKYAMLKRNKIAVEYFWHKLPIGEKARNAYACAKFATIEMIHNLLWSSLTHLSKKKLLEFLSKNNYEVSQCFIQCPNDHLFFATLDIMWDMLSGDEYLNIFYLIVRKMAMTYSDKFHHIMHKFWCRTPDQMKYVFSSEPNFGFGMMWIKVQHPDVYEFLIKLDSFPFFNHNTQDN